MSKYYVVEVNFNRNNKVWEQLGGLYPAMHKAVEYMLEIDLSFPTRIVKVTQDVVLAEKYERTIKRRRMAKEKSK